MMANFGRPFSHSPRHLGTLSSEKTVSVICPGQGLQYAGMGSYLYHNLHSVPSIRRLFEDADSMVPGFLSAVLSNSEVSHL